MPYLEETPPSEDIAFSPSTAGELTYGIQQLVQKFIFSRGLSYETIASVLGSIEGARLDFENRVVEPYENWKAQENGDVWDERIIIAAQIGSCPLEGE